MRINRRETQAGLSRNQAYLASCWHNLVHSQSLDSHRVRVLNPEFGIDEMLKMQEFKGASPDERKQVRDEVFALLKSDPLLNTGAFDLIIKRLIAAMTNPALEKESPGGPVGSLLKYFASELDVPLKKRYVSDSLDYLAGIVIHGTHDDKLEQARFADIRVVVNNMLSTLISRGTALESLFTLCNDGLLNQERPFERRWQLVSEIILGSQVRDFHIVIALDNVTSPEDFPPNIGGIQFSRTPQLEAHEGTSFKARNAQTYLRPAGSRLFASATVNSHDARVAGDQVLDRLNQVVNLIRFEYEAARVTVREAFAYKCEGKPVRTLLFPARVPNPSVSLDSAGVRAFIEAVDELVLHAHFQREGRDRVHSAFRLYRTGLDTTVLENKLTNWWTALEYLVRGAASDSAIGQSVEKLVAPVLAASYLPKHLIAHRNVLVELCPPLQDPIDQKPIELKSLSLLELYDTLRRTDIQALLLPPLKDHPYIEEHVASFLTMLRSPKALHGQSIMHERRLRWHLQRLWRARCDIVHSASSQRSLLLLCANLEYYLKSTLMALLNEVRRIPTLSGPKEFFDRQLYTHIELQEDLKSGQDVVLKRILAVW